MGKDMLGKLGVMKGSLSQSSTALVQPLCCWGLWASLLSHSPKDKKEAEEKKLFEKLKEKYEK